MHTLVFGAPYLRRWINRDLSGTRDVAAVERDVCTFVMAVGPTDVEDIVEDITRWGGDMNWWKQYLWTSAASKTLFSPLENKIHLQAAV